MTSMTPARRIMAMNKDYLRYWRALAKGLAGTRQEPKALAFLSLLRRFPIQVRGWYGLYRQNASNRLESAFIEAGRKSLA